MICSFIRTVEVIYVASTILHNAHADCRAMLSHAQSCSIMLIIVVLTGVTESAEHSNGNTLLNDY